MSSWEPLPLHYYGAQCIAEAIEVCAMYRPYWAEGNNDRIAESCLEAASRDLRYPESLVRSWESIVRFSNRAAEIINIPIRFKAAAQLGATAGRDIGASLCSPSPRDPKDRSTPMQSQGGWGPEAEAVRRWRWRPGDGWPMGIKIGTGAATAGAAWYFWNRPNGGSGTGSGGGDVIQLRPPRQPLQVSPSDVDQAARVTVGGGILAVLGVIAARLLMFTPEGAAASVMMLPGENTSEIY